MKSFIQIFLDCLTHTSDMFKNRYCSFTKDSIWVLGVYKNLENQVNFLTQSQIKILFNVLYYFQKYSLINIFHAFFRH